MPLLDKSLSSAVIAEIFDHLDVEVHIWKLVKDNQGSIVTWELVYINPITLNSWGLPFIGDLIGKTTEEIFGEGSTEHYREIIEKVFAENESFNFKDYFPKLDKHFKFTTIPFGDYFITTGSDISEFVQEEEQAKLKISLLDSERQADKASLNKLELALDTQKLIEEEKDKIYQATLHGAQHIVFNLLNQLQWVTLTLQKYPNIEQDIFDRLDNFGSETKQLMDQLAAVDQVDAEAIKKSVKPK